MVIQGKHIVIGGAVFIVCAAIAYGASKIGGVSSSEKDMERYIMEHPEVIMTSLQNMQNKQMQKSAENAKNAIKDNLSLIYENADDPRLGLDAAKTKIVEFFDYNCGYCKKALENKNKLLSDKALDAQIILKELPVLGSLSELASRYSLAVKKLYGNEKYQQFHEALLSTKLSTEVDIQNAAKKLSLDVEKLKEKANSEDVSKIIANNHKLAMDLGVRGTPGYIVEDSLIPGYIDYEGFKKIINEKQKETNK